MIYKTKDVFYEKGDNFQENPVFQLYREFKKIIICFEKLDFPLQGKGILGLEEK